MSTVWFSALLGVLAVLVLLRRPLARLLGLVWRSLGGLAALALLSPAAAALGIRVGINWINALVLGLLGVPGFGLLLLLQWLLHIP